MRNNEIRYASITRNIVTDGYYVVITVVTT